MISSCLKKIGENHFAADPDSPEHDSPPWPGRGPNLARFIIDAARRFSIMLLIRGALQNCDGWPIEFLIFRYKYLS
jgi:hypothetical protein